jgi:hypothetical protein
LLSSLHGSRTSGGSIINEPAFEVTIEPLHPVSRQTSRLLAFQQHTYRAGRREGVDITSSSSSSPSPRVSAASAPVPVDTSQLSPHPLTETERTHLAYLQLMAHRQLQRDDSRQSALMNWWRGSRSNIQMHTDLQGQQKQTCWEQWRWPVQAFSLIVFSIFIISK